MGLGLFLNHVADALQKVVSICWQMVKWASLCTMDGKVNFHMLSESTCIVVQSQQEIRIMSGSASHHKQHRNLNAGDAAALSSFSVLLH